MAIMATCPVGLQSGVVCPLPLHPCGVEGGQDPRAQATRRSDPLILLTQLIDDKAIRSKRVD
eukprot:scaffold44136_cov21-Phaeocystis_antarctica.AAC.1